MIRTDGVELHVEPPAGDGELLVVVHGSWTDARAWAAVVPGLARTFTVLTYDRRGHSRSERGPSPSSRREDEDDLAELIRWLDRGPAHLVGTSLGAAIALGLAARRPQLVRSVVAHEPPLFGLVRVPMVEAGFRDVWSQIASGDAAGGARRFFEDLILGPGGWERIPEWLRRAAVGNAQAFVDLREDPDWATLDVAAMWSFPGRVVVTRGEASPAWLGHVALGVADRIGRETRLVPGAGHSPHLTHPAAFAALVEDLIAGDGERRRAA